MNGYLNTARAQELRPLGSAFHRRLARGTRWRHIAVMGHITKSLVASFAAALLVSGCASVRLTPAGVSGNAAYVSVSNVWNSAEALPYAEKHCAQYEKIARFKTKEEYSFVFDCVEP